jgi:hypothetical protein
MWTVRTVQRWLSSDEATFGVEGGYVERAVVYWPSGRTDEFKTFGTGHTTTVRGRKAALDYR